MDKPLPRPDFLTAPFWQSLREGVFALPTCKDCGKAHFYPRPDCPHCGSEAIEWKPASGRGTVYSFTVVHRAPSPAFKADVPYVVAIVETEEGPHLMSRLTGIAPDVVRVGMPLKVRLEAVAEAIVLPMFEAA
jgi:uncharacterized OB-fold protein